MIVKGVKEELLHEPGEVSKLPDIIEYALPHKLQGIRDHIQYEHITMETFNKYFRILRNIILRILLLIYK